MRELTIPIDDATIRQLKVGESVLLSGTILTGRDTIHKWLIDTFIKKTRPVEGDDEAVYSAIKPLLHGGIIYHCGPVVSGLESGNYQFIAAGPTTSIREEPYQGDIMQHFNIKGVIGKGGMGSNTLKACQETPGVYFHAIGGAATLIAQSICSVTTVHKLDFGVPEAIWVIEVEDFPVVVTMDANGNSLHDKVNQGSQKILEQLIT